MSAKQELKRLVELLSDYECKHLLGAVEDIAAGDRFWEDDIAILYNEYAKTRYFNLNPRDNQLDSIIPGGPSPSQDLFVPIPVCKSYAGSERIRLPGAGRLNANLSDTLLHRRSRRAYGSEPISLEQLSTLFLHGCGTTGYIPAYGYTRLPLRSFPCSGALQSPEVYLSIRAVDRIASGLYHYHPGDHVLEALKPGEYGTALRNAALGQSYLETAAVVFLITGCYPRLRWKYGHRAYRYMCMDVGFLAENLYLAGEGLGLGVCAISGFVDEAIENLLEIDGKEETALLLVTVGVPTGDE